MKPWCVVRFNPEQAAPQRFADVRRGSLHNGQCWAESQEKTDMWGHWYSTAQQLWYVDTEEDARMLAADLASKNSTHHYITAKCVDVYKTNPGPVSRAQFTKDGLIPL